jgi:4-hydroxy-2-oxoheptanedioate aldolase
MNSLKNNFKTAIKSNVPQIGLWMTLADPYAAEICATAGFHWLSIDCEHAPNDLRTVLQTLQSTAAYPCDVIARLPDGNSTYIKQILELGVMTVVVPMVETVEQAKNLVKATRYPPAGIRGVGSAIARSSRWMKYSDYLQNADNEICLIVQIESVTGMQNIQEICEIDGIDGVLIGPADLSASMGFLGQSAHPEVISKINDAITSIKKSGKSAGILCTDETLAKSYIKQGANFIAVGVDSLMLVGAARNLMKKFV